MKSTFEKKELEAVFKITVEDADWESAVNKAYNRTKGKYKIPGFRPGKAPRRMIELHYGPDVFFNEAVDECVNDAYYEQLSAHPELDVFGQPEVNFDKPAEGAKLAFTITVTLNPVVKLGEYKGIKLPKIEYNVSDEDVDTRIKADLAQAARNVSKDGAAANGDITVIDYVGTVDGVEFEGGKAEKYEPKLGCGSFIPGLEDELVSAVKRREGDVRVKLCDEYHAENQKGNDAIIQVEVNDVMTEEIPELNDELVKARGRYETVAEDKAGIREALEVSAKARERNERVDVVMKAVTEKAECTVPEKIIAVEVERMYAEFEHQMSHYGISPEDYLKYNNSSPAQFREERKEPAERNIKMRQVMKAIIAAENIEVSQDEVKQKLRDPNVRAELEHAAKHNGGYAEEYAYNDLLTDKFFDFLLSNNEFTLEAEKTDDAEKKPAAKKPAAKKPAVKKTVKADKPEEEKAE